jgi:preprotein translocase subunit SecG
MYTVFIIIHLIVCFFLIFIVLIQSSKGAELGAAFGGSNQTLFGSRGAATFLNKLTTGVAIAFMLTSLILAVSSTRRGSIMPENAPAREAPVVPLPETVPGSVEE